MPQSTRSRIRTALIASVGALVLIVTARPSLLAQSARDHWVGTWSTSEVARPQTPPPPAPPLPPFMPNQCPVVAPATGRAAARAVFAPPPFTHFTNQTLRQIVHTSIGGSKTRVVLSNVHGTAPLTIGAAHMALRDRAAAIQPASDRPLTFSGRPTMTIPANAIVYSDPVDLAVPPMADFVVDLYLPGTTNTPSPLTMHQAAFQTNYVSETGNHVGKTSLPTVATVQNWFVLSRVDVLVPASVAGLVTVGDSITDGTRSTPDTNSRWPDQLMRRVAAQPGGPGRPSGNPPGWLRRSREMAVL